MYKSRKCSCLSHDIDRKSYFELLSNICVNVVYIPEYYEFIRRFMDECLRFNVMFVVRVFGFDLVGKMRKICSTRFFVVEANEFMAVYFHVWGGSKEEGKGV